MRSILSFLLGFTIVFSIGFAYGNELKKEEEDIQKNVITKLYIEKYTGLIFAYVENGILRSTNGNESIFYGYFPRNYEVKNVEYEQGNPDYDTIKSDQLLIL